MPARERSDYQARRRAFEALAELGRELRLARLQHDLSQAEAGAVLGVSHMTWSRMERGEATSVSVVMLARAMSVVGLDLALRAYPGGTPLRDAAHLSLLGRLRERLGPGVRWATEVPFPVPGDLRAWDAVMSIGAERVGVEAETRVRDVQALERRLALKERDGGVDHLVLLLADTRHHRMLLASGSAGLRVRFPVDGRACLASLAASRAPAGNAIVLL